MECGIGYHCALVECSKLGSASPAPQAPLPATIPANHICDISKLYGNDNITGKYKLTTSSMYLILHETTSGWLAALPNGQEKLL
jgi:hypothetical protein